MKKTQVVFCSALIIAASTGLWFVKHPRTDASLFLANVEALSSEDFPDGWAPGFTMATVWYKSGSSVEAGVELNEPNAFAKLLFTWTSMSCCIASVDSNACCFTNENPECRNRVIRGRHD